MAGILALIGVIRLLDILLPSGVWLPYMLLGAIFLTAGLLLGRKATAPAPAR